MVALAEPVFTGLFNAHRDQDGLTLTMLVTNCPDEPTNEGGYQGNHHGHALETGGRPDDDASFGRKLRDQ